VQSSSSSGVVETTPDRRPTEWFNEGWEGAPHRILRSALEAAQGSGWRSTTPPHRTVDRDPGNMAMYAGLGVGDVTAIESAATVVADLVGDLP
jgi:hypothetical protein